MRFWSGVAVEESNQVLALLGGHLSDGTEGPDDGTPNQGVVGAPRLTSLLRQATRLGRRACSVGEDGASLGEDASCGPYLGCTVVELDDPLRAGLDEADFGRFGVDGV